MNRDALYLHHILEAIQKIGGNAPSNLVLPTESDLPLPV